MNMREKKKNANNSAFYIALCCCVGIIGLVGYLTNQSSKDVTEKKVAEEQKVLQEPIKETVKEEEKQEEQLSSSEAENKPLPTLSPVVEKNDDSVAVAAKIDIEEDEAIKEIDVNGEDVNVLEKGEPEEFYEGETVESVRLNPDIEFLLPVDGEICEKFSGSDLIYNEALGDYRTHNGIDIKASAGADVLASADGVIEEIYKDYLGNTVVISHDNGFKTKYSCLADTDNLTVGTKVTKGSNLSKISDKAIGENCTEPHLHFELIKNEEFVNPEDYME